MGIDLRLQRLQLTQALLFLFVDVLLHQLLYFVYHYIEGFSQPGDFVISLRLYLRPLKIAALHLFHGIFQPFQRTRNR